MELPQTSEIFPRREFAARHPTILNLSRLEWALRNRRHNGLTDAGGVFESRGGELLIREPAFLAWFLGLSGRSKPRRLRRRSSQALA